MVKRFDLLGDYGDVWIGEAANGDYVRHSDYAALKAELETVKGERDAAVSREMAAEDTRQAAREFEQWWHEATRRAEAAEAKLAGGEVTEADLKRAYLMGREQWCPAGILSDTARTERDWQRSRAALRGDAS